MKEDGPHGIRRNVLRQLPPKSGSLSVMDTEQAELPPQHPRRDQTGYQVGNRHTYPYACLTEIPGQDQQTGNQYQHLTAIPMLWKKFDVTIWNPTIGKNSTTIRSPSAD